MNPEEPPSEPPPQTGTARRHDLDALRAIAMLLGIGLHAAMSLGAVLGTYWSVADVRRSGVFDILFLSIHGFRMPLFFLLSGFFTAMLWRKRGLRALLSHRFRRIFLPLLIGAFTIVPLTNWVIGMAVKGGFEQLLNRPFSEDDTVDRASARIWEAIRQGRVEEAKDLIDDQERTVEPLDAFHPVYKTTILAEAAMQGHEELVRWLLVDKNADPNATGEDGATALHAAAFFGRPRIVERLLEEGVDPSIQTVRRERAEDIIFVNMDITRWIAGLVHVTLDETTLQDRREEVARILNDQQGPEGEHGEMGVQGETGRPGLGILGGFDYLLGENALHHLWFLWYLCLMVVAFAVWVLFVDLTGFKLPKVMLATPLCLLWIVPLTIWPGLYMEPDGFGPDTSAGLLPAGHVWIYYTIFFWFGAMYWDTNDRKGTISFGWMIMLPVALFVIFPLAVGVTFGPAELAELGRGPRWLAVVLQTIYCWLMTLGLMGLFRSFFSKESRRMRYVSDSSYWLYVAHIPLVIWLQHVIRSWEIASGIKFVLLCTLTCLVLLVMYQYLVRTTPIGTLLNGQRKRIRD